jgi:hypothetical protein
MKSRRTLAVVLWIAGLALAALVVRWTLATPGLRAGERELEFVVVGGPDLDVECEALVWPSGAEARVRSRGRRAFVPAGERLLLRLEIDWEWVEYALVEPVEGRSGVRTAEPTRIVVEPLREVRVDEPPSALVGVTDLVVLPPFDEPATTEALVARIEALHAAHHDLEAFWSRGVPPPDEARRAAVEELLEWCPSGRAHTTLGPSGDPVTTVLDACRVALVSLRDGRVGPLAAEAGPVFSDWNRQHRASDGKLLVRTHDVALAPTRQLVAGVLAPPRPTEFGELEPLVVELTDLGRSIRGVLPVELGEARLELSSVISAPGEELARNLHATVGVPAGAEYALDSRAAGRHQLVVLATALSGDVTHVVLDFDNDPVRGARPDLATALLAAPTFEIEIQPTGVAVADLEREFALGRSPFALSFFDDDTTAELPFVTFEPRARRFRVTGVASGAYALDVREYGAEFEEWFTRRAPSELVLRSAWQRSARVEAGALLPVEVALLHRRDAARFRLALAPPAGALPAAGTQLNCFLRSERSGASAVGAFDRSGSFVVDLPFQHMLPGTFALHAFETSGASGACLLATLEVGPDGVVGRSEFQLVTGAAVEVAVEVPSLDGQPLTFEVRSPDGSVVTRDMILRRDGPTVRLAPLPIGSRVRLLDAATAPAEFVVAGDGAEVVLRPAG